MVIYYHHKKLMGDKTMKKQFKILITEDAAEFSSERPEIFDEYGFTVEFCPKDGVKVLERIRQFRPDIVLMDIFMSSIDGLGVIKQLKGASAENLPVFVIVSNYDSPMLEHEALSAGAAYFVIKPYRLEDLLNRIAELLSYYHTDEDSSSGKILSLEKELEITVTEILHQIGVPAHIKGYHYLRDSIIMCVRRPEIINAAPKELYPAAAENYETTSSRVERAIRHAIEVAWDRGDVDILNSYFGYTIHNGRGKPTNSEFIAMISDRLRLHNRRSA